MFVELFSGKNGFVRFCSVLFGVILVSLSVEAPSVGEFCYPEIM
mgnify:CR=1 FL=1